MNAWEVNTLDDLQQAQAIDDERVKMFPERSRVDILIGAWAVAAIVLGGCGLAMSWWGPLLIIGPLKTIAGAVFEIGALILASHFVVWRLWVRDALKGRRSLFVYGTNRGVSRADKELLAAHFKLPIVIDGYRPGDIKAPKRRALVLGVAEKHAPRGMWTMSIDSAMRLADLEDVSLANQK